MSTIFIVLGTLLLGGGAYAVFDGWPYLLIERGFTQVIIGTVVACAGILVQAMGGLLIELRRFARMTAEGYAARISGEAVAAGAGLAAAGAAGAVAAAIALDREEREPATTIDAVADDRPGPDAMADLFAAGAPAAAPAALVEDPSVDLYTPAPDPFLAEPERVEETEAAALDIAPARDPAAIELPEEAVRAAEAEERPLWWPNVSSTEEGSTAPAVLVPEINPLDNLRRQLTEETRPRDANAEPAADDAFDLGKADAWLRRPLAPRSSTEERWPDAAPVPSIGPEAGSDAADEPPQDEPGPDLVESPHEIGVEPKSDVPVPEPEIAGPEPEPPAPAASDEGVIGAYQVGDAQFTMYADGSIRASTPDGDFRFGSMEELKAFLASEKNRLGV